MHLLYGFPQMCCTIAGGPQPCAHLTDPIHCLVTASESTPPTRFTPPSPSVPKVSQSSQQKFHVSDHLSVPKVPLRAVDRLGIEAPFQFQPCALKVPEKCHLTL